MFIGHAESSCSQKNQIYFPGKFRKDTGDELLITNWFEYSLVIVPFRQGEDLMKILTSEQVSLLPEGRRLERFLYSGAEKARVNSEGRFTLPQHLKDHAMIQKDVVLQGVGNRIELWSKESYERYSYLTEEETRKATMDLYKAIKK